MSVRDDAVIARTLMRAVLEYVEAIAWATWVAEPESDKAKAAEVLAFDAKSIMSRLEGYLGDE